LIKAGLSEGSFIIILTVSFLVLGELRVVHLLSVLKLRSGKEENHPEKKRD